MVQESKGETTEEIVMVSALVAVLLLASVTWKVILLVPATAGVPVIAPVDALRFKPAGNVPENMLQAYNALPPVAASTIRGTDSAAAKAGGTDARQSVDGYCKTLGDRGGVSIFHLNGDGFCSCGGRCPGNGTGGGI